MSDRWAVAAEAVVKHDYEAFFEAISTPVFGDLPPSTLIQAQFDHPRLYRLWTTKMERAWPRWVEEQPLPENDQFFLNREISREYKLKLKF